MLYEPARQELIVTREQLAFMLGVRREGITELAGRFQDMGFIQYRRRHISVLDRMDLKRRACECYVVVQTQMERLILDLTGQVRSRCPRRTWPATHEPFLQAL